MATLDDLEIVGRCLLEEIVQEGIDTPAALEGAVYNLTEWLTELDAQPGDELLLIRRTPVPAPALVEDM